MHHKVVRPNADLVTQVACAWGFSAMLRPGYQIAAASGRSGRREENGGRLQATHARPVPKKEAGALDRREKGSGAMLRPETARPPPGGAGRSSGLAAGCSLSRERRSEKAGALEGGHRPTGQGAQMSSGGHTGSTVTR
jgi:hypothetical protein